MKTSAQNVLTVAQNDFLQHIGAVKMPRYVAINGYKNKDGAVANYVININHKYKNKVKKDVGQLKARINVLEKCPETALEYMALTEILNGFLNNADKATASAQSLAQNEAFDVISGSIKRHTGTGEYYLYGYLVSKKVLVAVDKKPVNSRPLTIAKKAVQKELRTSKYVQFKLSIDHFSVTVNGSTLTLEAI